MRLHVPGMVLVASGMCEQKICSRCPVWRGLVCSGWTVSQLGCGLDWVDWRVAGQTGQTVCSRIRFLELHIFVSFDLGFVSFDLGLKSDDFFSKVVVCRTTYILVFFFS